MSDPQEQFGCACPRIDGKDCAVERQQCSEDDDYECPCGCHDLYEDSLRDDEDAWNKPETPRG